MQGFVAAGPGAASAAATGRTRPAAWIGVRKTSGESPSGKAPDFDSGIRRFDPYLPSQILRQSSENCSGRPVAVMPADSASHDSCITILRASLSSRMAYDNLMVFTGNANPKLARGRRQASEHPSRARHGRSLLRRRSDGRDAGERARQGCVRAAVDLRADQRQPDGSDGDGRCAEARVGRAHHRGDPVLRLRAPGPPAALGARGDQRQGGGQHAGGRRRGPRC